MAVRHLNEQSFDEARNSEGTVLLDFFADWCGPCRMLAPVLEAVAKERPDVLVAKVNVDECPALAGEFGVFSIPTLVVMKNGKVVSQAVGVQPKDRLLALLD